MCVCLYSSLRIILCISYTLVILYVIIQAYVSTVRCTGTVCSIIIHHMDIILCMCIYNVRIIYIIEALRVLHFSAGLLVNFSAL